MLTPWRANHAGNVRDETLAIRSSSGDDKRFAPAAGQVSSPWSQGLVSTVRPSGVRRESSSRCRASDVMPSGMDTMKIPANSVCSMVWLTFSMLQFCSKSTRETEATMPGRSRPSMDRNGLVHFSNPRNCDEDSIIKPRNSVNLGLCLHPLASRLCRTCRGRPACGTVKISRGFLFQAASCVHAGAERHANRHDPQKR